MKNAYDTFATWNDGAMAAGFDGDRPPRQTVTARRPESRTRSAGGNKVIDLNAWRAANLAMLEKEAPDEAEWADQAQWEADGPEPEVPASRLRKSRRAMVTAELASTLSAVAVAVALAVRVLMC